jgi:hypothetical protein
MTWTARYWRFKTRTLLDSGQADSARLMRPLQRRFAEEHETQDGNLGTSGRESEPAVGRRVNKSPTERRRYDTDTPNGDRVRQKCRRNAAPLGVSVRNAQLQSF